jgi:hypothetical protein
MVKTRASSSKKGSKEGSKVMSFKAKTKIGFNHMILRDGNIVALNKDGTERYRKDRITGEPIKTKGKK